VNYEFHSPLVQNLEKEVHFAPLAFTQPFFYAFFTSFLIEKTRTTHSLTAALREAPCLRISNKDPNQGYCTTKILILPCLLLRLLVHVVNLFPWDLMSNCACTWKGKHFIWKALGKVALYHWFICKVKATDSLMIKPTQGGKSAESKLSPVVQQCCLG